MKPSFHFDEASHTYYLDNRKVPGVTSMIRALMPGWLADEYYLQRGRAIHHGCRLLDQGVLDWKTVVQEIKPRVLAWQKFMKDSGAAVLESETPMSSDYGYAGTPDRLLEIDGEQVVADLKSSCTPQVIPQLGFYSIMFRERGRKPTRAVAVELHDDETYKCLWLNAGELRRAEMTAKALLTVYNFMSENNLFKKEKGDG